MTVFERYLSVWVLLSMASGVMLGRLMPELFRALGEASVAGVNLPVGALVWAMIIPMLARIDFRSVGLVRRHARGIVVTVAINWVVKPLSMAVLGALFIRGIFAPALPAGQLDGYVAGLVLLAAAPCTAMVFVWSRLSGGDPLFTLSQVALNDLIMLLAFGPIVALLLGVSHIAVPWETLWTSVLLYIAVPLMLAQLWRRHLLAAGEGRLDAVLVRTAPVSVLALLLTLVLLFALQAGAILAQPVVLALLCVPILLQVALSAALAYWLNRAVGEAYAVACPSALIGASNFFELAVATAISLFGLDSAAALATVAGVLVEVPAMLLVVRVVGATRGWYERQS